MGAGSLMASDGQRRLECPDCQQLLCKFPANAQGGPFEFRCERHRCRKLVTVYFNPTGEVLRQTGLPSGSGR